MLTPTDWQNLLLLEVGAGIDGKSDVEKRILDKLTPNLNVIWIAWADKAFVHPRMQYLYAKRQCLDILIGQFRDLVSTTIGGFNANQQQRLQNMQEMRKTVDADITKLETQSQGSRSPAVGTINQTSPVMAELGRPDPNASSYRGDAIVHPRLDDPFGWKLSGGQ